MQKIIILLFLAPFAYCTNDRNNTSSKETALDNNNTANLFLFKDTNYVTRLSAINESSDQCRIIVELATNNQPTGTKILSDTLDSYKLEYDTTDFNNDQTPDLLVLKIVAQSNPCYYLYVVDVQNHRLHLIKGFDELYTPAFDKEHNVITTYWRSGTELNYGFYKIDAHYQLVDLKQGFKAHDEQEADSLFKKAIETLSKE